MDDPREQQNTPPFRIWLCGAFRVERRNGVSYGAVRTAEWGGSSYPRLLLKALLCCPGRQARREALLEMLWPNTDPEQAAQNLNTATTKLRKVLQSVKGHEGLFLTEDDCKLYLLEGQHRLWVDVDAAFSLLKEAERLGRTSSATLSLLEEADSYFSKGTFLQDEEGHWTAGRRATVEQVRYRCRLWLAGAYEQQGMPGQAETVLSLLFEEDPTDEDVLYRLLSLLHRQGMTHQALRLYEHACKVFSTEGVELTEATKALAAQLQEARQHVWRAADFSFPLAQQVLLSNTTVHTIQASNATSQRLQMPGNLVDTLYDPRALSEAPYGGANDTMDRREASKKIALTTLGMSLLTTPIGLMQVGAMFHDEEILAICTTSIPILWRLYFDGQLSEVRQALPGYLSQLALLTRQSRYQQQAAHVASKAHQLACMLALQEQDYGFALIHVDQALFGANVAEAANLQVASLIRRALVYRYLKRFQPMLEAYQEADQYSKSISPLLQGRLYTGLAEAHSNFEREYEAKHFLERAYTTFPENPLDDPHFPYTHFKLPQGFEAIMYLNLKQPKKAWEALAHVDKSLPEAIVPDRVELSIDQAKASLLLGEITQSCQYLKFAAISASALGSALRYNEASSLYQHIQRQWPREQQVKDLAGYFQ